MTGNLIEILAANVRRRRQELALSQDELASRCDLHRTYVGGVERGERNITLLSLERLAAALEVSPLELLSRRESRRDGATGPGDRARRRPEGPP